jgi:uroporphyrinogen decarboxylase
MKEYRTRDYPLQLTHRGVYGFARERMGDENLAYAFYDEPEMVHDMMKSYTDMAIKIWEKQVADVAFDLIECWEDMASKSGSLISPEMFREFMSPCYKRIANFAREHSIKVILVDSDGLVEELTGLMLEAGVTALYPYEVLAGNDVARVLARYPAVGVIGGLRKEAMYEGKEAIDKEMVKARALIKKGRYIPGPDHFVLQMASFANYRYFMESLREVVMTTEPEI